MFSVITRMWGIIVLLIIGAVLLANGPSLGSGKKHVLILNSYHPGYRWSDNILKGIHSVLGAKDHLELFVEYMDTKRHDTDSYLMRLKELYAYKYAGKRIDAILSSDDHALDFLLKYRGELFPGVPIVFCGVDKIEPRRIADHDLLFGVEENLDFENNLRMGLRLHPQVKTVAVLSDHTKSGLNLIENVRNFEHKFSDRVQFRYLTNLTIEETRNSLVRLPPESLVLYLVYTRDRNGVVLPLKESMKLVGKSSSVPVYIAWDTPITPGIMGGYIASGYDTGALCARLVARIFDGDPIENLPKIQVGPHINVFNYPVMRQHGLKVSHMPKNSIIVNQPHSFYREYKTLVWNVVAAFLVLVLIVFLLSANIFRRKRAEKKLLESEARLKTLLETANEGFWEVNNDATVVDLNPEMSYILGRNKEEILGHGVYEFLDETNKAIFREQMVLRKEGKRSTYELQFQRTEGTTVHCLIKASPLFGEYHNKVGSFAMVTDITDRKKVEEELLTSKKVLAQSESMYRAISEFFDYGIMLFGQQEIIYSNRRLAHFMGLKGEGISKSDLFKWICGEDLPLFRSALDNLLQGPNDGPVRLEFCDENGTEPREYLAHGQLMEYDDQSVVHMFIEDITEQKEMARRARLNELRMYHDDRLSALGTMATGIAHELNQPLNTTRVITDGLLFGREEGWELDAGEVFDNLEMISHQVVRMSEVIRNIRNFAREDRALDSHEIDPNEAIENVFSMIGRQLVVHDIKVQKQLEPNLPRIRVRINRLEQVIMNLVVNAQQALDECEKVEKNLWIKTGVRFGQVFIEVGDNASGIPEKNMAKIFDPFYTTKKVGKGTGLGLSISKTIVSEFRGRMEAYNNKKGGGTFFITAPCKAHHAEV